MSAYSIMIDKSFGVLIVFYIFGKLRMDRNVIWRAADDLGFALYTKAGELGSEMLGDG